MKVVHVAEDLSPANTGITSAVIQLAKAGIEAGHTVEAVTIGEPTKNFPLGMKMHSASSSAFGLNWRYSSEFDSALQAAVTGDAILHVHGIWMYPQFRAVQLAAKHKWPIVVSPHNMLGGWLWNHGRLRRAKKRLYFELFIRNTFSSASVIHALSDIEHATLSSRYFKSTPIATIPNALDLVAFDHEKISLARVTNLTDRYVLFLGRLHPVKGVELLIEAVATLNPTERIKLILAGPAPVPRYEQELRKQIERSGLQEIVSLIGPVYGPAKWNLLCNAWVLCAPSFSEGISMVALEAMAANVPVITTHGAGLEDLTSAGGFSLNACVREIANALQSAASWSKEERICRGVEARSLVERRYSWPVVWPRYEALYTSIV